MDTQVLYNFGRTMYPLRGLINHIDIGRKRSYGTIGGGSANDLQGSNNFSIVGSPQYDGGSVGALSLNPIASGQYLTNSSALNFTTSDFTIIIWAKIDSLATNVPGQGPVLFFKGLYNTDGYYMQCGANGSILFTSNHPANATSSTPASSVTLGSWQQIAVTKQSSLVTIYSNSVNITNIYGAHGIITNSGRAFNIGYYPAAGQIYAKMYFSALLGYSRALSAQEILECYDKSKRGYGL